jgi:predicted P-loop ATPase
LARVGERDHTILRAVGLLAYWLPAGCPWELVKELLRPSLSAMLDAEPDERGLEYMFGVAEAKYAKQAASRAAADAKRAEEDAKLEAFKSRMVGKTIKAIGEEADVDLADGWEGVLLAGKSGPKVCEFNVDLILTCAPEFRDALTWNEFAKTVEVRGGDLDGIAANSLDGRAAGLIQSKYGCMAGEYLVGRSLLRVARENPYDPISEYLGEIAWDGTTRLDTFFEKYLGVDISDPDSARYVRAVSRRWLISLIARALRPGCKVDTVLILEGVQGAGKSTALEELVGSDYFLDTALEIGNKDTLQAIAGAWLIELGELASFRKAESNRIRQFITSKVDKFRPPFGRLVEPSPRRCVLVGTTNDKEYLSDRTGNRRYWPVRVGAIDVEGVRRDRDLILAEAVVAFRVGERWWLTEEEERSAQAETEARVNESTAEEAIERWWYGEPPAKRPAKAMLLDVAEMALKLSVDRVDHRIRMEIGYALHRLGFTRKGRERYYEPTEEMLTAPQRTTAARASTLALVTAMKAKGDIK